MLLHQHGVHASFACGLVASCPTVLSTRSCDGGSQCLCVCGIALVRSVSPEMLCCVLMMQGTILANLKDPDVSIRRRALDLLFTMCDGGAAVEVVEELVSSLTK